MQKIAAAKEKGIDFIICDHHNPADVIPDAYAVLDPKQPDCNYPFKDLSGCGVGFKLCQAFSKKNDVPVQELYDLLDLVVVSIASDIVPVTGENRILSYFGLKKLATNPCLGLKTIIQYSSLNGDEISISDIVFKIGPRINASGRIEHGKKSLAIMVVEDEKAVAELCRTILEQEGYEVMATVSPREAIELCERHPGDIDLLITDVIMPEMNGKTLKEQIEALKPGIKALYMSGYPADVITDRGILPGDAAFIQKPFSFRDLAAKIREVLEAGKPITGGNQR